jgi:hypothetical protein
VIAKSTAFAGFPFVAPPERSSGGRNSGRSSPTSKGQEAARNENRVPHLARAAGTTKS